MGSHARRDTQKSNLQLIIDLLRLVVLWIAPFLSHFHLNQQKMDPHLSIVIVRTSSSSCPCSQIFRLMHCTSTSMISKGPLLVTTWACSFDILCFNFASVLFHHLHSFRKWTLLHVLSYVVCICNTYNMSILRSSAKSLSSSITSTTTASSSFKEQDQETSCLTEITDSMRIPLSICK